MITLKDKFKLPELQHGFCINPCSTAVYGEKAGFEIYVQAEVPFFSVLKYKRESVGLASSSVTPLLQYNHSQER